MALAVETMRPTWHTAGACAVEPSLPWTERLRPTNPTVEVMRQVCAGCAVLDHCTTWIDADATTDQITGVLAAMTDTERRARRKKEDQ